MLEKHRETSSFFSKEVKPVRANCRKQMGLQWRKELLDLILVPISLLIMFGYHLFLLYRYLRYPHTTILGYENHNMRAWVQRMVQIEAQNRGPAVSVIGDNISAANSLASVALVLSSLIGAWLGSSTRNVFTSNLIYGDTSSSIISMKYVALLICFLLAFGAFVHTSRRFVHANFLITMPNTDIPTSYVEKEVIRGSLFWELGMRAFYLAITLLLWVFGPIPLFVTTVVVVGILYTLDTNTMPLHQYQPVRKKIGDEIRATTSKVVKHHERPREDLESSDNLAVVGKN